MNPDRIEERLADLDRRMLATITATHAAINRAVGLIAMLALLGVGLVLL